ncbi:DNA ligase [Paenibacillus radicis (ex Xue et al. 2023)]|uniref:DNA ligase n=1 Tax=Paenibacillus radicis (ex Xue et al. 2023) TaxID=2972489 RepID=A0ABT1YPR1_9BACL|nr:DNA ligase [Paenibacillus radicis (ex Xue et al. 2023)]MCR8635171.1 DNA ligase [Paenibacillus radicis (ex Xue et al. 2023)]
MLFTRIKPMLLSLGKEPFDDDDFIFEPKWDGWRILLHKQGERIEAYTSNGHSVTDKFPELKEVAAAIKAHTAILDSEGIVLRGQRPVFDDFTYRGRLSNSTRIKSAVHTHPASFIVFDVLCTDREHMKEPLLERKQRISEIVAASPSIMPTMYLTGKGNALFELTKEHNMEGIVAKRKASRYIPDTKSKDWLQINHVKTVDVLILGYRTSPFGLVIGLNFRTVKNKPVGVVELGFKQEDKLQFLELAQRLHTTEDEKTQWIQPCLCCRIEYLERTDMHQLKTTLFKGFLLDKKPEDCVWIS